MLSLLFYIFGPLFFYLFGRLVSDNKIKLSCMSKTKMRNSTESLFPSEQRLEGTASGVEMDDEVKIVDFRRENRAGTVDRIRRTE